MSRRARRARADGRRALRGGAVALLLLALAQAPAAHATGEERAGESEAAEESAAPGAAGRVSEGPIATPNVALARFTTAVENREPIDSVTFLSNEAREIVFFTDLRDLAGNTVTHRWEHAGEVVAEVPFEVRGSRWRVWSSKELRPDQLGTWTVSVVSGDGEVLAAESFTYQEKQ